MSNNNNNKKINKYRRIKISLFFTFILTYINFAYLPIINNDKYNNANTAHAWVDPCKSCHFYLAFCCPKPCPNLDIPAVAGQGGVLSRLMLTLQQHHQQQVIYKQQEEAMGVPGKRGAHVNAQAISDYLELSTRPYKITTASELQMAKVNAYADTMELLPRINAMLIHAEEAAISADQTMRAAPDVRGMKRADIRLTIADMKVNGVYSVVKSLAQLQQGLNTITPEQIAQAQRDNKIRELELDINN